MDWRVCLSSDTSSSSMACAQRGRSHPPRVTSCLISVCLVRRPWPWGIAEPRCCSSGAAVAPASYVASSAHRSDTVNLQHGPEKQGGISGSGLPCGLWAVSSFLRGLTLQLLLWLGSIGSKGPRGVAEQPQPVASHLLLLPARCRWCGGGPLPTSGTLSWHAS